MANQYIPSSDEIVNIKKGSSPSKVIDEGDSLDIDTKVHSFYWPLDGYKKDDYEPVGINGKIAFTRFHYHGLCIWEKFSVSEGKPIVTFSPIVHTPILCTQSKPIFRYPSDLKRRIELYFLLGILKKNKINSNLKYELENYSNKLVNEDVPEKSLFTLKDIKYLVLITENKKIEDLDINDIMKEKLEKIFSEQ